MQPSNLLWPHALFLILGTGIPACGGDSGTNGNSDGALNNAGSAGAAGVGGSSGGAGTGAAGSVNKAEAAKVACAAQAKAYCAGLAKCTPIELNLFAGTPEHCEQVHLAYCVLETSLPNSNTQPSDVMACAVTTAATSCADLNDLPCPVVPGKAPAGTPCWGREECASSFCLSKETYSCGVCKDRVPLNGACGQTDLCESGTDCNYKQGVCKQVLPPGATCSPGDDCTGARTCRDGQCQEYLPLGAPCLGFGECADLLKCDQTGFCTDPKFAQRALPGEKCTIIDGYSDCTLTATCTDGTCVLKPTLNCE